MIERTEVDTVVLPTAMLPTVKAHCRVEHARDDALLTTYTQAAIRTVESKCNVSLNPATYVLTGDEFKYGMGLRPGWWSPLNNVLTFKVDNEGSDTSADYLLGGQDFGGNTSNYLYPVNPPASGKSLPAAAQVTLEVGVDDPALLAPAFLLLILRLTGSMYENREASSDLWAEAFSDELMGMWRPGA
jgi:hypothetical protein